ncbi:MAG: hypothetical protein AAB645_01385 [Patescibacteria group bacterium]
MMQNTLHRQTAKFIASVIQSLPELAVDIMQGWIQNPKALQETLTKALCPPPTEKYSAIVDYGLSLALMIQRGKYNWVNDRITAEWFLTDNGRWEVECKIVHFDQKISSEDAVRKMKEHGLKPAKIEELLAFDAVYPDFKREFPVIIALGSVMNIAGDRRVPVLERNNAEYSLNLNVWCGDWSANRHFLVVRHRRRIG